MNVYLNYDMSVVCHDRLELFHQMWDLLKFLAFTAWFIKNNVWKYLDLFWYIVIKVLGERQKKQLTLTVDQQESVLAAMLEIVQVTDFTKRV